MAISTRKSKTSKGIHSNVAKSTIKLVKRNRCPIEHNLQLVKAWRAGRNPWITIANPNKNQTNKQFIRVEANKERGNYKRTAPSNQSQED
jgi:hypothetical protein